MMRRSVRPSIRPWRTVKHDAGDINAVSDKEGLTLNCWIRKSTNGCIPIAILSEQPRQTFFEAYEEFIEKRKLSDWRVRAIQVVIRALKRYELYARRTVDRRFTLDLDTVTSLVLGDFEEFLRNEHTFCEQYPEIYEAVSESRTPQPRGQNTINGILTKLRTFFLSGQMTLAKQLTTRLEITTSRSVYEHPITFRLTSGIKSTARTSPGILSWLFNGCFRFQCLIGCRVVI